MKVKHIATIYDDVNALNKIWLSDVMLKNLIGSGSISLVRTRLISSSSLLGAYFE